MNVSDTQRSSVSATSTSSVQQNGANELNDLFMTLLVAQIQNQDPLNPTDGTEYVSQLAQMTQVQSMESMKMLMQNNAMLIDNLQVLSTASLVGQTVMVQTSSLELSGQPVEGRITLQHPANSVSVIVKDATGAEHKIDLGDCEAGQVDFTLDPKKMGLDDGKYTLSVISSSGEESIPIEVAGTVNNVRIPVEGGSALLNISGLGEVPYYSISQFGQSSGSDK